MHILDSPILRQASQGTSKHTASSLSSLVFSSLKGIQKSTLCPPILDYTCYFYSSIAFSTLYPMASSCLVVRTIFWTVKFLSISGAFGFFMKLFPDGSATTKVKGKWWPSNTLCSFDIKRSIFSASSGCRIFLCSYSDSRSSIVLVI